MQQNPYSPAPSKSAAWNEGFAKGFVSNASPQPGDTISDDDLDAFNDGVQTGVEAQISGIDMGVSCIEASDSTEETESADSWIEGAERLSGASRVILEGFEVGAIIEAATVSIVLTLIMNPVGTQPVDTVLPSLQQPLIDRLADMGLDNFALYCGVGIDPLQKGCELKASPFFKTQDQAADAASAMGRGTTAIVSWRTDQCGSFTVIA